MPSLCKEAYSIGLTASSSSSSRVYAILICPERFLMAAGLGAESLAAKFKQGGALGTYRGKWRALLTHIYTISPTAGV